MLFSYNRESIFNLLELVLFVFLDKYIYSDLLGRCKSHSHYNIVPGSAFIPDSCAFDPLLPYMGIYIVNVGSLYITQYGLWGRSRGWLIAIITLCYFVTWIIISTHPSFMYVTLYTLQVMLLLSLIPY